MGKKSRRVFYTVDDVLRTYIPDWAPNEDPTEKASKKIVAEVIIEFKSALLEERKKSKHNVSPVATPPSNQPIRFSPPARTQE